MNLPLNLPRLLSGCLKALGRADDWEDHFDFSRKGLQHSFIALILSLPFYYICAAAVQIQRSKLAEGEASSLPTTAFFVIWILYAFMFVLCAYIFCLVFNKPDRFRPWVVVRHWTFFFASLLAAALFGLNMAGILPFMPVVYAAFVLYLGTLAIDIRYAQKIAGFEWGAAIFAGCIITAMSLMMILVGVAQYA